MQLGPWVALTWVCLLGEALGKPVTATADPDPNTYAGGNHAPLSHFVAVANASTTDVQTARAIVKDAIAKMAKLNKARIDRPARNNYKLRPDTRKPKRGVEETPPLLTITEDLARAAALLAELDAKTSSANYSSIAEKGTGAFWLGNLDHKGSVPWGDDNSYKVNFSGIEVRR